jgi:hypothetical protein
MAIKHDEKDFYWSISESEDELLATKQTVSESAKKEEKVKVRKTLKKPKQQNKKLPVRPLSIFACLIDTQSAITQANKKDPVIKLNVGGKHYETKRSTLQIVRQLQTDFFAFL